MRKNMRRAAVIGVMLSAFLFAANAACAQSAFDVGAGYSYVHTNAPAGDCGCFSMNGGSGWLGFHLGRGVAIVGEFAVQHAGNVANTGADLTLTSFLAGPRYTVHAFGRLQPSAQILIAGGGLEFQLSERVVLRAIEVDYYYTRFNNGTNDHQNNLRIGAGVAFRFGKR